MMLTGTASSRAGVEEGAWRLSLRAYLPEV